MLQGCERATRWNDRVGRKKLNFIKGDENKSRDAYVYNEKKKKTIRTGKQVKKNEVWNLLEHSSLLMDKNSSSTKSTPMRIEWKKVKVNIKNSSIIPCNFF